MAKRLVLNPTDATITIASDAALPRRITELDITESDLDEWLDGPCVIMGAPKKASLQVLSTPAESDLLVSAKRPGVWGNAITFEVVLPTDTNVAVPLAITVENMAISVSLQVDTDGSTVLTTANALIAAIAADSAASALVELTLLAGEDGTGLLDAATDAPLAGGHDGLTGQNRRRVSQIVKYNSLPAPSQ